MSGPKGTSYVVVSPEELARREAAGLRARLIAQRSQIRLLEASAGPDLVKEVGQAPAVDLAAELAQLRLVEGQLSAHQGLLEEAVRQRYRNVALEAMRTEVQELQLRIDLDRASHMTARPSGGSEPRQPARSEVEDARLARTLTTAATLPAAQQEQVHVVLRSLAEARGAGHVSRATMLTTHLETLVEGLLRKARIRQALETDIRRLKACFAEVADAATRTDDEGLPGEVASAVAALDAASDREQLDMARSQLDQLRQRCRAAEDRAFVLRQAIEVLGELGYSVGEGEPVDDVRPFIVTSPRWPRHALQFVMRPDLAAFNTVPMAVAETDARDDVAFERATCEDLARLRSEFTRRGVVSELYHETPAAQLPMRRASSIAKRAAKTARRGREASK